MRQQSTTSQPRKTGTASRRMVRGTAAYAAAAVLQRAMVFLLLPFFARVLTPAEFGQIGVLTTLAAAITVLVGFGLETAMFRGYSQLAGDAQGANAFVNTVGGFALVVPVTLAIIFAAAGAAPISQSFSLPADALRLAGLGAALTASATLVPLAVLRAQERLRDYLQLTVLQVVVTPVLTILFVAVAGWGVSGWMLAYALSSLVLLVRGLAILGHRWTLSFELHHLSGALRFGIPLIPHGLSHWGLAVSDRAILGAFVSASLVGAYYIAYVISLPISLVAVAVSQATQPVYAEAIQSRERVRELGPITTIQTLLVVLAGAGVALVGPPVLLLLLPPDYAPAAGVIPWLAAGTCLFGLYLMPMNAISVTVGRTQRVWIITVLAAGTNIVLNLALVPQFGTAAAAVDTTIGYGVLLGWCPSVPAPCVRSSTTVRVGTNHIRSHHDLRSHRRRGDPDPRRYGPRAAAANGGCCGGGDSACGCWSGAQ